MSDKALANFYRQFATMVDAGLPVNRILTILAQQNTGATRRLARLLEPHVKQGTSLSEAMTHHPRLFTPLHLQLVKAGEASGQLDRTMIRLADSLEKGARLRVAVVIRLIYPVIVIHVAILAKVVIAFFYQGLKAALISLGLALGIVYGVVIGGWLLYKLCRAIPATRALMDALAFHTPVLRGIIRHTGTARFARTAEALYSSGHNITHTLGAAAEATGNTFMTSRLRRAVPVAKEGDSVAIALSTCGVFTPMVNGMIQTGVESGRLDQMLLKVAENAEHSAEQAVNILGIVLPILVTFGVMIWVAFMIVMIFADTYLKMIQELTG